MTDLVPCRLLVEPPGDGAWLMAVDEVLLQSAAEQGLATLRFYCWREPTLSLGYFQSLAERAEHAASRGCPVARRQTGGGAILHDRELTYSLALPETHPLARKTVELYDAVHTAIIDILAKWGISARRCGQSAAAKTAEPFLCFQRRAGDDILIGEAKVCGSAQRRRHGAVLQHGSILMARSPAAPELPGIAELTGIVIESQDFVDSLGARMAAGLHLKPGEPPVSAGGQSLAKDEQQHAEQLVATKYGNSAWTARR